MRSGLYQLTQEEAIDMEATDISRSPTTDLIAAVREVLRAHARLSVDVDTLTIMPTCFAPG